MVSKTRLFLVLSVATFTSIEGSDPIGYDQDVQSQYTYCSNESFSASEHSITRPCCTSAMRLSSAKVDKDIIDAILDCGKHIEDEFYAKSLLRDLEPTGGARLLRDLALRTRIFKRVFRAWEDLHTVTTGGLLRDQKIVQRLWSSGMPDRKQAIQTYDEFKVFVQSLASKLFPWVAPYHADHMSLHASYGGRGLVFTTGDGHASYLLTSIPAIRALGCDLPIEIMYLGDDDLNGENRELLDALPNVVTRDMSQMIDDSGWKVRGWAAKPFAILHSSFREVIFIDADALFFQNPHNLFTDADYLMTGALFFRDRKLSPEDKKSLLRAALPKPISRSVKTNGWWTGESGHVQDSGVIVLDKRRHFVELLLAARLNGPDRDADHATGKKGIYELMYGDKETFWLSWEMAGSEDYAFHKGSVGNLGGLVESRNPSSSDSDDEDAEEEDDESQEKEVQLGIEGSMEDDEASPSPARICSSQLLHFDLQGNPLWFNGWLATSKFKNQQYQRFLTLMKEPGGSGSPWTLKESNVACLRSADYREFYAEEQKIVDDLVASAKQSSRGL